jgi:heme-binding NEAT domain protein
LLDREIKTRKQAFGIEIYDLMALLEVDETLTTEEKEAKIRSSFDAARKDIAVIAAKRECKLEEMAVIDAQAGTTTPEDPLANIPPSSGSVVTNAHPQTEG